MENVRNIRKENNMYYILPEHSVENERIHILPSEIAVIAHLYYIDTLEVYFDYFEKIPTDIIIYIVSSNPIVWERVRIYSEQKSNIVLLEKKNRGRDISALLVAGREIVLNYKYVCFVHDKKEKNEIAKRDTDLWIRNLWDNTLKSAEYIQNVLNVFSQNPNIGLLVPPEPMGEYFNTWYMNNAWGMNYENTKQLADELGLNCNLDERLAPITIGTAFWCKVDALKKLFEKKWNYEDFDEEPLANDGTLSHAIERIFAYVAQDAGYDTGIVMATSFAARQINFLQESMTVAGCLLKKEFGIKNIHELNNFEKRKEGVLEFCKKNKSIYLYGAGEIGKRCLQVVRVIGYRPDGFIVSKSVLENDEVEGIPVKEWDEIENTQDIGVIVTVGRQFKKEVISELEKKGFHNYIVYIEL